MNVTIHERTSVDYDLEIHVPAEELETRMTDALRQERKKMNLKGFRPGRVPLNMVRKMHGSAIAAQVAEQVIGEAWRTEIAENDDLDVLGTPRLMKLDFEMDSDLNAVLRFGVRPVFELEKKYDREVRRLVRPVSDDDVEEEIERRLMREAKVVDTNLPADEESVVVVDIQAVDKSSDTPIIGQRDEDRELDLTEEHLRHEMRKAIVGLKPGDATKVDLPHHHAEGEEHDHEDVPDRYLVTVKEVRHRMRPELDEEFVREKTAGQKETVEEYREMVRSELEQASRNLGEDFLQEELVRALLEEHDFPVPESLTESVLEEMEQDLAKRVGGELPPDFDRDEFRANRQEAAEHQARWMLIQDRFMEETDLSIDDESMEAEFERLAESGPGTAEMIKQFVASQPQLLESLKQRMMSRRLFEGLGERFQIVDISPEELEKERAAEA